MDDGLDAEVAALLAVNEAKLAELKSEVKAVKKEIRAEEKQRKEAAAGSSGGGGGGAVRSEPRQKPPVPAFSDSLSSVAFSSSSSSEAPPSARPPSIAELLSMRKSGGATPRAMTPRAMTPRSTAASPRQPEVWTNRSLDSGGASDDDDLGFVDRGFTERSRYDAATSGVMRSRDTNRLAVNAPPKAATSSSRLRNSSDSSAKGSAKDAPGRALGKGQLADPTASAAATSKGKAKVVKEAVDPARAGELRSRGDVITVHSPRQAALIFDLLND